MDIANLKIAGASLARKIIRALVPVLLHCGVGAPEALRMLQSEYISGARRRLRDAGGNPTSQDIALHTGFDRRTVSRMVTQEREDREEPPHSDQPGDVHRAAAVLTGWHEDPDFIDARGKPSELPFSGSRISFTELVVRYGGNFTPRAMLKELLHYKAVTELDGNLIRVESRVLASVGPSPSLIEAAAEDVAQLLAAVEHNLQKKDPREHYLLTHVTFEVPPKALPVERNRLQKSLQNGLNYGVGREPAKNPSDTTIPMAKLTGIVCVNVELPLTTTKPQARKKWLKKPVQR